MTDKTRNYFLTINKQAKCYERALELCQVQCNEDKLRLKNYFFIVHNKALENEHKHIVLQFNNALRFDNVKNIFAGSHIEPVKDVNANVQYLTHLNNPDKKQYSYNEIITNNKIALDKYYNNQSKEIFNANLIIDYYNEGCTTFLDFYKRFGANINNHIYLINNVLNALYGQTSKEYQNMISKRNILMNKQAQNIKLQQMISNNDILLETMEDLPF